MFRITDFTYEGKTVFLRADLNSPPLKKDG